MPTERVTKVCIGDTIHDHEIGRSYTVVSLAADRHDNLLTVTRDADGAETLIAVRHLRAAVNLGRVTIEKGPRP